MSSVLAIPGALDVLRSQITQRSKAADIALPLRALQLRGLSKLDLTIHIERIRATNDATAKSALIEDQSLLALDIVNGTLPGVGLTWDARHDAASLLARCLDGDQIHRAIAPAMKPSDLLPPRPTPRAGADTDIQAMLARTVAGLVEAHELLPEPATLIRAPRGSFTTRPAALLRFFDRVVLEALAEELDVLLASALPTGVLWPRARDVHPEVTTSSAVLEWKSKYIAKADIASFFDSVSHAQLAVFLVSELGLGLTKARAIEAVLTSTMQASRGLPQGPPSSDSLATAYLLPVDRKLVERKWRFVRYQDDYYFAAESMNEGREALQQLETLLEDLELSLNDSKTGIMKRKTFKTWAGAPPRGVGELKQSILDQSLGRLDESEDPAEILERMGVPEQMTWDLLYHQTIDIEELVEKLTDTVGPGYAKIYEEFFKSIAKRLRRGGADPELHLYSYLARESLVFLAASQIEVSEQDLATVQTWFPELTPHIARYLITAGRERSKGSRDFIATQLREPSGIDWVDAWTCHAAGHLTSLARGSSARLRKFLSGGASGPLTEAEAARALAAHGVLREEDWMKLFEHATPAISSEMFFVSLALPVEYPWVRQGLPEGEAGLLAKAAKALARRTTSTDD